MRLPHPRRVQAVKDGRLVIDTERALLVHRRGRPLSYVFAADEVADLPSEPEPEAPGFVSVPWGAVDTWWEEGRKLVHYPPNPYHRVDCLRSSRPLRVEADGTVLVDTTETMVVHETALDPRLYVDPGLVRVELTPSQLHTYCPYKGEASYYTVTTPSGELDNAIWFYRQPYEAVDDIADHVAFYPERVDAITQEGRA